MSLVTAYTKVIDESSLHFARLVPGTLVLISFIAFVPFSVYKGIVPDPSMQFIAGVIVLVSAYAIGSMAVLLTGAILDFTSYILGKIELVVWTLFLLLGWVSVLIVAFAADTYAIVSASDLDGKIAKRYRIWIVAHVFGRLPKIKKEARIACCKRIGIGDDIGSFESNACVKTIATESKLYAAWTADRSAILLTASVALVGIVVGWGLMFVAAAVAAQEGSKLEFSYGDPYVLFWGDVGPAKADAESSRLDEGSLLVHYAMSTPVAKLAGLPSDFNPENSNFEVRPRQYGAALAAHGLGWLICIVGLLGLLRSIWKHFEHVRSQFILAKVVCN